MGIGVGCVTASARRGGGGGYYGGGRGRGRPATTHYLYSGKLGNALIVRVIMIKRKKQIRIEYTPFSSSALALKAEIAIASGFIFGREKLQRQVLNGILSTYLRDKGFTPSSRYNPDCPARFILYCAEKDNRISPTADEIIKNFFRNNRV